MRIPAIAAGLLSALLLVACGGPGSTDVGSGEEVTLTLNWYPYGEHAPLYYGVEKGIFAKHGIKLKIQPGQGSGKTVQAVGGGQTDFGWADTAALMTAVESGVRVKSLGVFLQTTPASVQFFSDKDIARPADLKGRRVATTAGDALSKTFPAFLKQNGMSENDVQVQNTDPAGKIAAVMSDRADVLLGYATDQGPTIRAKSGKPVSYLKFADFGLNYFSNGLITSTALLEEQPDLAKRMAEATAEAWAAAEQAPQDAIGAMDGASQQLPPPDVLSDQLTETLALLHTDATKDFAPGVNTAADWKATIDTFVRAGVITKVQEPSAFWDENVAPKGAR